MDINLSYKNMKSFQLYGLFWFMVSGLIFDQSLKTLSYYIASDSTNYLLSPDLKKISGAAACYNGYQYRTTSIPGATWIWDTNVVSNADVDQISRFYKPFYISGTPLNATLQVAVDNQFWTYINGVDIGCETLSSTCTSILQCDVTKYIHQGLNIITFEVNNSGCCGNTGYSNPAGLLYKLAITENSTDS
jgi:hypothetical protein